MKIKSQEKEIIEKGLIHKNPYFFNWNKKDIVIYPDVFSPKYAHSSIFLASFILKQNFKGKRVLDMGTGCGLQAIASTIAGAKEVIAIDINEKAIKNTLENVGNLKLKDKIRVKKSNLFSNVNGRFDIIIANLPFIDKKPKNALWMSVYDKSYKTLKRFFKETKEYLKLL